MKRRSFKSRSVNMKSPTKISKASQMDSRQIDINVIQARGLVNKPSSKLKDTYVSMTASDTQKEFRTGIQFKCAFPQWNSHFSISAQRNATLSFQLREAKRSTKDKVIAWTDIDMSSFEAGDNQPRWYQFKTNKEQLRIYVEIRFVVRPLATGGVARPTQSTIIFFPELLQGGVYLSPVRVGIIDEMHLQVHDGERVPEFTANVPQVQYEIVPHRSSSSQSLARPEKPAFWPLSSPMRNPYGERAN